MKKWVLILVIVLIVVVAFILFALQQDFGQDVLDKVVSTVKSSGDIPQPPPLPS